MGADRVLTSGQQHSAVYGMPMIEALVQQADGRIAVVPCGGVRPHNVYEILEASGAREVQFTATKLVESDMEYRNTRCSLASGEPPKEFERRTTDAGVVRSYLAALDDKA